MEKVIWHINKYMYNFSKSLIVIEKYPKTNIYKLLPNKFCSNCFNTFIITNGIFIPDFLDELGRHLSTTADLNLTSATRRVQRIISKKFQDPVSYIQSTQRLKIQMNVASKYKLLESDAVSIIIIIILVISKYEFYMICFGKNIYSTKNYLSSKNTFV
jgi:hypothetical protein